MPGTLAHDSLAPALHTGVTLNAAGTTTTSPVAEIDKPGECRVKLTTGTVASTTNSATLNVEIKSSNDSTFATGVVSHGRFSALSGTDAAQSAVTKYLDVVIYKRYVRASVVVGGTAPDYSGTTITVEEPDFRRQTTDSA